MSQASATLIAHRGAETVSREDLKSIRTPESTRTHKTVPHHVLVDTIETTLNENGIYVAKQDFAVMGNEGGKMFGTLTLKVQDNPDFSYALGVRTANDKSMAVQMVAGLRVFVCDNLAFSGEKVTLNRKHTSGLDIRREIAGGVTRAIGNFTVLDTRVKQLKEATITDQFARSFVAKTVETDVIAARLLKPVLKEYFEPRHKEFEGRTGWSLYNAYTEVLKPEQVVNGAKVGTPGVGPNTAFKVTLELGKLFKL